MCIEANPIFVELFQKKSNRKKKPLVKEENISTDLLVATKYPDVSTVQQEAAADDALIGALIKGSQCFVGSRSYNFTGEMQELDANIKSMMVRSQNMIQNGKRQVTAHICTVCGKEGLGRNIKDHIEANHIDGVSVPCNFCEKTFRSRNALRLHSRNHTVA